MVWLKLTLQEEIVNLLGTILSGGLIHSTGWCVWRRSTRLRCTPHLLEDQLIPSIPWIWAALCFLVRMASVNQTWRSWPSTPCRLQRSSTGSGLTWPRGWAEMWCGTATGEQVFFLLLRLPRETQADRHTWEVYSVSSISQTNRHTESFWIFPWSLRWHP